jgi:hypothetical protein
MSDKIVSIVKNKKEEKEINEATEICDFLKALVSDIENKKVIPNKIGLILSLYENDENNVIVYSDMFMDNALESLGMLEIAKHLIINHDRE